MLQSTLSTMTMIAEPDAAGVLHLPLPEMMCRGKVRVVATALGEAERGELPMTEAENAELARTLEALRTRGAGLERRQLSAEELELRRKAASEALVELRRSNPYADIADPVNWQREIRADVALRSLQ